MKDEMFDFLFLSLHFFLRIFCSMEIIFEGKRKRERERERERERGTKIGFFSLLRFVAGFCV